jgi:hypothetical protein
LRLLTQHPATLGQGQQVGSAHIFVRITVVRHRQSGGQHAARNTRRPTAEPAAQPALKSAPIIQVGPAGDLRARSDG